MKLTKRQLRKIIKEEFALMAPENPSPLLPDGANVPVPKDYEATRTMLMQNPELVDIGIDIVMQLAGTSCERSTMQAIIDHLQDLLNV